MSYPFSIDPKYDLVLERDIDVPVDLVWKAWTTPEHLMPWFCPRPWTVTKCKIDLQPGGEFSFTMRSPEGKEFPNSGCYLEVVPNQRLIWTDTMQAGYRPAAKPSFTGGVLLTPKGTATHYKAIAIHGNEETRKRHEEMGFHDGWGIVATQMVEFIKAGFRLPA